MNAKIAGVEKATENTRDVDRCLVSVLLIRERSSKPH